MFKAIVLIVMAGLFFFLVEKENQKVMHRPVVAYVKYNPKPMTQKEMMLSTIIWTSNKGEIKGQKYSGNVYETFFSYLKHKAGQA